MRNNWLFFMDLDGGSPYILLPLEALVPHRFGVHLLSQISSFVDSSIYHSKYLFVPGSLALQEAVNCISKFAGALVFWCAGGSNSTIRPGNSHGSSSTTYKTSKQVKHITSNRQNRLTGLQINSSSKEEYSNPVAFPKILSFNVRQLCKEVERRQSFSVLSLAAALIPPLDNLSPKVLAVPLESSDIRMQRCMDQSPCEIEHHGYAELSLPNLNWTTHAVEPRTGIEFPTILDMLAGEKNSSFASEVLVGTGSRTMTIIKFKSLKIYAFGFYVHPYDVCEKLGPKYASIPVDELNKRHEFYEDLLREDINMTVRLVVNCNGIKINTVRNAFQKSLRARLVKTNPDTDYHCLKKFDSLFSQDVPLREGTTINFHRTADGHLITSIGGDQIGSVHSKDLCRAFFDMYIGDIPVSQQAKEEIGRNVASIITRC